MTTIINVGPLGAAFRGVTSDGVTQYLGIKYASLRDRFAEAEIVDPSLGSVVVDATRYGPSPISPSFGCELEQRAIQHALPAREAVRQSETDCLSLNIYLPADTGPESRLPVFLFIHGGGLVMGATCWPQSDMKRLVRLSVEMGLPIIAVSINYRLGIFGFLTSKELRDSGYKPNNGLRDQQVAMLWVRKYIHLFGGDSEAVTLAGISAGAAAVTLHLKNLPGLFKRAIVMSGSYFMTQPLTLDVHEEIYEHPLQELGLLDASPDERRRFLVNHPADQLLSLIPPSVAIAFAVDGDLITSPASFKLEEQEKQSQLLATANQYGDLLVGNTQMDASICSIFTPHWKEGAGENLTLALYEEFNEHPIEVQEILDKYGISETTSHTDAFTGVLNFINDVVALAPVVYFARSWPGSVNAYYFNEGNPWDGAFKGQASHLLDQAFLFQNYREFLDERQQAVAVALAEDVFKFCHGIRPWPVADAVSDGVELPRHNFPVRIYGTSGSAQAPAHVAARYDEDTTMRRRTVFDSSDRLSLDGMLRVVAKFAINAAK